MYKTLRFFNFGTDVIRWISVLYKNANLCVIQNGIFSKFFNIGRGCRQGDPVSPYIFILCAEIMGHMIRQNKNIKGIKIGREEICLLQYADDTVLFMDGSEKSLQSALNLLFQYSKYSGLKPNISKTKAVWIGSKINSADRLCKDSDLEWTSDAFTVLGITFTASLDNIETLNFEKRILDIEKEIMSWSKRNISTLGKITVVKSLLIPKITHLLISLPRPDKQMISKLEKILFKFIWNGNDRVSRKTMVLDYKHGGCRMPHLDSFIKSLKLTWIRRILNSNSEWISLFPEITNCSCQLLSHLGSEYSRKIAKSTKNLFWREVLITYSDFITTSASEDLNDILLEPLWYNNKIKVDNKCIFYKRVYEKGFHTISDLLDRHGKFISYGDFTRIHSITIPFTVYTGLRCAITNSWPVLRNIDCNDITVGPHKPKQIHIICKDRKGSRAMYDIYLSELYKKPVCEDKWVTDLNLEENLNWKDIHYATFICTKDTKLQWFNYRIINRILGTNKILFMCKIKNSPLCSVCKNETETIKHLFFYCPYVSNIWSQIGDWILQKTNHNIDFNAQVVLFGRKGNHNKILNLIILLIKYVIFQKTRTEQNFSIEDIKRYISSYYQMERKLFTLKSQLNVFQKKMVTLEYII